MNIDAGNKKIKEFNDEIHKLIAICETQLSGQTTATQEAVIKDRVRLLRRKIKPYLEVTTTRNPEATKIGSHPLESKNKYLDKEK